MRSQFHHFRENYAVAPCRGMTRLGRDRARVASRSNESPSLAASTLAVPLFTRHRAGGALRAAAARSAARWSRAHRVASPAAVHVFKVASSRAGVTCHFRGLPGQRSAAVIAVVIRTSTADTETAPAGGSSLYARFFAFHIYDGKTRRKVAALDVSQTAGSPPPATALGDKGVGTRVGCNALARRAVAAQ